jgi:hypothetical protein
MTPVLIFLAFIAEAFAHYKIIEGLTVCGQDKDDNNAWHYAFAAMWFLILFMMPDVITAVVILTTRAFVFPIALNVFRGFPVFHLGEGHTDGFIDEKIGATAYYSFAFLFWGCSIFFYYA